MDGENNGKLMKTLLKWMIWAYHYFWETPIYVNNWIPVNCWAFIPLTAGPTNWRAHYPQVLDAADPSGKLRAKASFWDSENQQKQRPLGMEGWRVNLVKDAETHSFLGEWDIMLLNFVDGFRDTCNYRCVVMCVFCHWFNLCIHLYSCIF